MQAQAPVHPVRHCLARLVYEAWLALRRARDALAPGRAVRVVSDSELRTLRACSRRHHYAYRLRRRPVEKSEALRFGTLWHAGQEAWWREPDPLEKLGAGLRALHEGSADPFDLVTAEELLLAYHARWSTAPIVATHVEAEFRAPIVNPSTGKESRTYRLGGKIDAIALDDGRACIVEHKTTSSDIEEGSSYLRRVRALDTQVSTYMLGARALGVQPEKCIYDIVRKPTIRPAKATPLESRKFTKAGALYANQRDLDETPEQYRMRLREDITERPQWYLTRVDIVRFQDEEREHAEDLWQLVVMLRDAERQQFAPRNPDACGQYGGCPYLVVCEGMASIEDETLFKTAPRAHEELST